LLHFTKTDNTFTYFCQKCAVDVTEPLLAVKRPIANLEELKWPELSTLVDTEAAPAEVKYYALGNGNAAGVTLTRDEVSRVTRHDINPMIYAVSAKPLKENTASSAITLSEFYTANTESLANISVSMTPDYGFRPN